MTLFATLLISSFVCLHVVDAITTTDRQCTCRRRLIRCGDVPEVLNGTITGFISDFLGDVANVMCDEGLDALPPTITCRADGNWDIPVCTAQGCGDVPDILNGNITGATSGNIGDVADVMCDEGLEALPPTITCRADGNWDIPICADQPLAGTRYVTVFQRVTTSSTGGEQFRQLYITARESTTVNITAPFLNMESSMVVSESAVVDFPPNITVDEPNRIREKVVEITSDKLINVYTLCYRKADQTIGMDILLNRPQFAKEYVVIATSMAPQYSVVAIEDGTNIVIEPFGGGTTITQTINRFQVFTFIITSTRRDNDVDITGAIITSDKDVAAFSGAFFATVPFSSPNGARDMSAVQLIGVPYWSTVCLMAPFFAPSLNRTAFEYKIVASQNSTTVQITINGTTKAESLGRTIFFEEYLKFGTPLVIQSDKPILVAQFSATADEDMTDQGDSSMVQCLSPDRYLNRYAFVVPKNFDEHTVRITIETAFVSQLRLNGNELNSFTNASVTIPGGPSYSFVYIEVFEMQYYLLTTTNGVRFGADMYGTIEVGQYSQNLGQRHNRVNQGCGNVPDILNGNITGATSGNIGDVADVMCDEGLESLPPTITCRADGNWDIPICADQPLAGTRYATVFQRVTRSSINGTQFRQLYITAREPTNVTITAPFLNMNSSIVVNESDVVDFPENITVDEANRIKTKVVEITSDKPINVYTLCYRKADAQISMDILLNRPDDQLAKEYVVITTSMAPQYSVVAIEDGTNILIEPFGGGTTITQTINRFQVYTFMVNSISRSNNVDLTGAIITSDKDVAAFSGAYFATVPFSNPNGARDMSAVQLIGVPYWSTVCLMAPFLPRKAFEYKIVASQNSTTVQITINGTTKAESLGRTNFFEEFLEFGTPVVVQSDKPVLVAQFSVTESVDMSDQGDSSMVQCLNPDSYLNRYAFVVPKNFDEHRVRITIETAFVSQLRLNGNELNSFTNASVTIPGGPSYSFVYIEVFEMQHYLLTTTNGVRFGADMYENQFF